jgi:hypothetical protein
MRMLLSGKNHHLSLRTTRMQGQGRPDEREMNPFPITLPPDINDRVFSFPAPLWSLPDTPSLLVM